MKKLLIFLLAFSSLVYGQDNYKANIQVKLSKYINLPGSRLFIIPPDSFVLDNQMGINLTKIDGSEMVIIEKRNDKYSKEEVLIYKEKFEVQKIKIFKYQDICISGFCGNLLITENGNLKYLFCRFGDSTFLTTITSGYSSNDIKTEKDILESINSIYFDKNYRPKPFEHTIFKLDTVKTAFTLQNQTGRVLTFMPNGRKDKRHYVIFQQKFLSDTLTLKQNLKRFSVEILAGDNIPKILSENIIKVDGHNGYEFEMAGTDLEGEHVNIYCAVIKKGEIGVFVHGFCNYGDLKSMAELKKFAYTIRFNP